MQDKNQSIPALRVSQLDAQELNEQLETIFKQQLSKVFKYNQNGFLTRFDPEVTAVIRALLWQFSLYATGSTLGQQMLNLRYKDAARDRWISRSQTLLYGVAVVACPWLRDRCTDIMAAAGLDAWTRQAASVLRVVEVSFKAATLINFLTFLRCGRYVSLLERLLGIRSHFPDLQYPREVNFKFMTRELLWHGFSDVLAFLLPLINYHRLRNFLRRAFSPAVRSPPDDRSPSRLTECVACGDWPVCPRQIGCSHVFCYYCIQCNVEADPNYTCPRCSHPACVTAVHPVTITSQIADTRS